MLVTSSRRLGDRAEEAEQHERLVVGHVVGVHLLVLGSRSGWPPTTCSAAEQVVEAGPLDRLGEAPCRKPGSLPRSGWLRETPSARCRRYIRVERDFAERVEEGDDGVARLERDRLDERAGQDDVAGLGGDAVLVELVGQPGHGVDRVAHHRRGHAALLDAAVDRQAGADPADVDVGEPRRATAEHDEPAGGGVGDAVDQRCSGPRPFWRVSTISMHGSTKSVARMTSAAFTPGPTSGSRSTKASSTSTSGRFMRPRSMAAALEHEPVVEHRAVVGLGGAGQRAHGLRREADLVALHDAAGLQLQLGDRGGDAVGVVDVGVGVASREMGVIGHAVDARRGTARQPLRRPARRSTSRRR